MRLYKIVGKRRLTVMGMPDHPNKDFRETPVFTISEYKGNYFLFPEECVFSGMENPRWDAFQALKRKPRPWFAIDYFGLIPPHRTYW
jgi:hypothetical protein